MPGLVGIISKRGREWAEPQVQRMLKAICHEQFYQSGQWADESLGVCLGWTALKNSFADRMPLINEAGDIVLTFSGEEFPHPDTICRLQQKGHLFKNAGSDYLVHLCEDDPTFPSALNGRFHGLVADRRRAVAVLFNDRYGMHAVYYHESKDAFYFASEVKAILAVRPELRVIDARSLGEFVSCGCVLEDRTLFAGIYVL